MLRPLTLLTTLLFVVGCSDVPFDAPRDGGTDSGHDAGPTDAGQDTGPADSGFDAGFDGGQDAGPRFVVANGTVTDTTTGLVWQAMDWGTTYMQPDASAYCAALTLDANSNWRLPTKDEVVNVAAGSFPGALAGSTFWTSTAAPAASSFWYANFSTGAASWSGGANLFHARCVR